MLIKMMLQQRSMVGAPSSGIVIIQVCATQLIVVKAVLCGDSPLCTNLFPQEVTILSYNT